LLFPATCIAVVFLDYQNDSDLIPRNTSVIVVRRLRESFEPLTPATAQHELISFDNIIDGWGKKDFFSNRINYFCFFNRNLRTGLRSETSTNTTTTNELKLSENVQKSVHQTIKPTSYICHNCKRHGHIKRHCPLLIQSSTAKMHGTIDSAHKSSISFVSPASISTFRPHSYLINNKNTLLCSVKESLSNKTQTSIGIHHDVPVSLSSSSNIFLSQSPVNSVQPVSRPSHIVSRSSPYHIPYGRVHRDYPYLKQKWLVFNEPDYRRTDKNI
jgi:hypothetical protein